jgi:alkylation response protein AidB-like acyl-CoA dehydrogenase
MDFSISPELEKFRAEVRDFLGSRMPSELRQEIGEHAQRGPGPALRSLFREMGEKGWLSISWPLEYGGQGLPLSYLYTLTDECEYHGVPLPTVALQMVGPTLMSVGSEEQKREFLPKIMRGEIEFALGYTEPNAGSDLASLTTRAASDGDDYVINGQKIFTTHAHYATHVWLATRTDFEAPKHRGITLIIVPMNAPGLTIRPLWTMSDERTNEMFFEDVRVPAANRVGEENKGWYYMTMALDYERASSAAPSPIERSFDDLIGYVRAAEKDGAPLGKDPYFRLRLAEMAIKIRVSYLFSQKLVWMMETGRVPNAESSMTKIWFTETRQLLYQLGTEVLGPYGQLQPGSPLAPLAGQFERMYRDGPRRRFTAGTNEIQRNIIAQRGLGLPR